MDSSCFIYYINPNNRDIAFFMPLLKMNKDEIRYDWCSIVTKKKGNQKKVTRDLPGGQLILITNTKAQHISIFNKAIEALPVRFQSTFN